MKTKNLVYTALFAAIICICAPLSIQIAVIPLSLATLAIYILSAISDIKISLPAVCVYILLGAVGLPVFSGFQGGFQKLAGVTGGYIVGYIPCVFIIGILLKKSPKRFMYPLSMAAGTAVLYGFGTAWYVFQTKTSLASALAVCVLPFLAGDAVKIAAASIVSPIIRKRIQHKEV